MRVLVTGGRGMVGRALLDAMARLRPDLDVAAPTRAELDLLDRGRTLDYLKAGSFDEVVHAAGRVGGIADNVAHPVEFLADNAAIGTNLIGGAIDAGVPRLLNLGSSCMYPRDHRQPLVEEDLFAGPLEPTNEGYAIAKLLAERLCRYAAAERGYAYRTVIPSNLYGPYDHFEPTRSHLVAAAIRKVHLAKRDASATVSVWGDGAARREFTYVTDLAEWLVSMLESIETLPATLNVGYGQDLTVREYYEVISDVLGYGGSLEFDPSKPAGMRQKLMDSARAQAFGWAPRTDLKAGIAATYAYFLDSDASAA